MGVSLQPPLYSSPRCTAYSCKHLQESTAESGSAADKGSIFCKEQGLYHPSSACSHSTTVNYAAVPEAWGVSRHLAGHHTALCNADMGTAIANAFYWK